MKSQLEQIVNQKKDLLESKQEVMERLRQHAEAFGVHFYSGERFGLDKDGLNQHG